MVDIKPRPLSSAWFKTEGNEEVMTAMRETSPSSRFAAPAPTANSVATTMPSPRRCQRVYPSESVSV